MQTSAIILSAGLSSRIGFPKAFLKWDEKTVIMEKLIAEFQSFGINEIIVVINDRFLEYYAKNEYRFLENCIVVTNNQPNLGRFYSIVIGCKALTSVSHTFIQNVDNPFTSAELLKELNAIIEHNDIATPNYQGKVGHPVLLSKKVIEDLRNYSGENYNVNFRNFIAQYNISGIDTADEKILVNINTLKEYKKYLPLP